jgi:PKD repeat protein
MSIIGKYEKVLPIEENPNNDYYIRGLNASEESVRIPFEKVGQDYEVAVSFWAFVAGQIQLSNFVIPQSQEVVFESRHYSPELVSLFKWTITHVADGTSTTSFHSILTHSFTKAGWYTVKLEAYNDVGSVIGSLTKTNHILVSEVIVPLYLVTFHVTSEGSDLQGALVSLGSKAKVTDVNGEASWTNIGPGYHGYVVSKDGYISRPGLFEVVDENITIEVDLLLEDSGSGVLDSPVYIGYLTEAQWDDLVGGLTPEIIKGETFPSQHQVLDTSINNAEFPDKVDAKWSDLFTMNPFQYFYQFIAVPESVVNAQVYLYFQNLDFLAITDLFEKIGEWTFPEIDGETYYVYRLNRAGPSRITLSTTEF